MLRRRSPGADLRAPRRFLEVVTGSTSSPVCLLKPCSIKSEDVLNEDSSTAENSPRPSTSVTRSRLQENRRNLLPGEDGMRRLPVGQVNLTASE